MKPRSVIISSGDLHNVGDLALLLQCAHGVRRSLGVEDVKVRQWSSVPADVLDQLEAHRITVLAGKAPVRSAVVGFGSLVMIGGGQMVRDNASTASLASLAGLMFWARATGGRAAILGCGVDRLASRVRCWLWRSMFRGASVVTVRDRASAQAAQDLCGPKVRPVLTADLAFLPSPLHEAFTRRERPPSILVAPCADRSERRGVSVDSLCSLVLSACDALGIAGVTLLAHDARPGMDLDLCATIAETLSVERPSLEIATIASHTLADYTAAYASAALVLANRLHPVIFALLAGRPIVILDDGTPKIGAAAERFSIPRISSDIDDADLAPLWSMALVPNPERARAVEAAKAGAAENFSLLAAALRTY